jgi:hypothetical protein
MRTFIVVALVVLGIVFYRQCVATSSGGSGAAANPPRVEATLTPRPASEHNWAKSALDRAQEVKQQVKRERASNQVPD